MYISIYLYEYIYIYMNIYNVFLRRRGRVRRRRVLAKLVYTRMTLYTLIYYHMYMTV